MLVRSKLCGGRRGCAVSGGRARSARPTDAPSLNVGESVCVCVCEWLVRASQEVRDRDEPEEGTIAGLPSGRRRATATGDVGRHTQRRD